MSLLKNSVTKKFAEIGSHQEAPQTIFSPVAGELLFRQPQGNVTSLHSVAGLVRRIEPVVADFKGIRAG